MPSWRNWQSHMPQAHGVASSTLADGTSMESPWRKCADAGHSRGPDGPNRNAPPGRPSVGSELGGSTPLGDSMFSGSVGQLARPPPCHGGHRAGSSPVGAASKNADMAQMARRTALRTPGPIRRDIESSTLSVGTTWSGVSNWLKTADCRSATRVVNTVGSNPTPTTMFPVVMTAAEPRPSAELWQANRRQGDEADWGLSEECPKGKGQVWKT